MLHVQLAAPINTLNIQPTSINTAKPRAHTVIKDVGDLLDGNPFTRVCVYCRAHDTIAPLCTW